MDIESLMPINLYSEHIYIQYECWLHQQMYIGIQNIVDETNMPLVIYTCMKMSGYYIYIYIYTN